MNDRIKNVLEGKNGNYILPFFWQHGEDEATLREYMGAIQGAGIGAVCIESRPHPDFAGPKWWQDMDVILDEARKRDMKVWILDDSHFPSGFANGALRDKPDDLRRQSITFRKESVSGGETFVCEGKDLLEAAPMGPDNRDVPFYVKAGMEKADTIRFSDDRLLGVFAIRKDETSLPFSDAGTIIELTDLISGGRLEWTAPDGEWSVCLMHLTRNRGAQREHINMMDKRSVRVFIDTVHEAHWDHYKEDFGNTIAGFFSDEPDIGNGLLYEAELKPGCHDAADFPWSIGLEEMLKEKLGGKFPGYLALLWENDADTEAKTQLRYIYMDCVSKLVKECFSDQIGDWCREHGVQYIGHGIEDNDITSRTGSALGHYFRGLAGQDMAGIDVIGGQLYPQAEDTPMSLGVWGPRKGDFFHFELTNLASSAAAIEPLKKGDSMCETFGAYGWSEGVYLEKYLLDHLMVRGINHFVPHAFSPKEFPDFDCPPHFYAHGHNPQYRHFGELMKYGNRVCELISGGRHYAPVAIAYDGESDWMGERESISLTARVMSEHQLNYDFLPDDVFADRELYGTKTGDGSFEVNHNSYRILLIPPRQYITSVLAEAAIELASQGIPVLFIDSCPEAIGDKRDDALYAKLRELPVVSKQRAAELAAAAGAEDLALTPADPSIKFYHYLHDDGTQIWLFANEGKDPYTGEVTFRNPGTDGRPLYLYDAWSNKRYRAPETGNGAYGLCLGSRKSIVFVLDPSENAEGIRGLEEYDPDADASMIAGTELEPVSGWKRSICTSLEYPAFHDEKTVTLPDHLAEEMPVFSGFARYTAEYEVTEAGQYSFVISDASEAVEVFLDSESLGIQIVPPFVYRMDLAEGRHEISVEAATTLEREMAVVPDAFGNTYEAHCLSGITGEVKLLH
ncbi:MAG: hypothetical protein J6P87_00385 [Lachnospiraceae bacterium]|nr:hypothetical protein [Lachnospiraceae bacterium]